jgi:parvulin-like peptidyl-prolyl isomerase
MSQIINIDERAIINQVKLSGKIPETVEGIMTRQVIDVAVKELGIEVTTEELQQGADQFRLINQLHSSEDTYKWLEKHQISLDEFENTIQFNLVCFKLQIALFQDKVEPHFIEQQLDYLGAVIYETILEDEDEAMELFYQIEGEETTFFEVARQHIKDIELRRKGGYRGTLYRKDLKPEISSLIFAANPPELLKPITTSQGVHLIQVEEIIKPQLNPRLSYQILSQLFEEWVKQKIGEMQFHIVLESSDV